MDKFNLSVNCAFGVENILGRELAELGFSNLKAENGSFCFEGTAQDISDCNMFLRTAERVYIVLAKFTADNFDALFDGVFSVPWQDVLTCDAKIIVNAKSVKSTLYALSSIQSIAKKAIIKKLTEKTGKSIFLETGAVYGVEVNITKDVVSVVLDTSGVGLHKRGYRDYVSQAPLKETLACALLLLSDFSFDAPFCDPFCGSGTIAIEAARIALNIASGVDRQFAYTSWKNFDNRVYLTAKEKALQCQKTDRKLDFVASDIDEKAIKLCYRHALRAGVSSKIRFEQKDIKDFSSAKSGGTIVTNPPYGQRLLDLTQAQDLMKILGQKYALLSDWSLFVLSADMDFEKSLGKRADKKRKLFNAQKQCNLYQYFKQSNNKKRFTHLKEFL